MQSSRSFREYLAYQSVDKERIDRYFNVNSLLPKSKDIEDFRINIEFYEKLIDVQIVMRLQNVLIEQYQIQLEQLIASIDDELDRLNN